MKYYIIVGESSGDLYGGRLINEINKLDSNAQFQYWGGPKMLAESRGQKKSLKDTAFMGFWEVARNLPAIKKLFDFAKKDVVGFQADVLILIDYPGFNLRMAKWARNKGIKVIYYISPQLWAWKEKRHLILRKCVDLFFVILPFEVEFYKNLDTPCIYYGHPLLEFIPDSNISDREETIGLFPGSRLQEISKHLPLMIKFAERHTDKKFVISAVGHIEKKHYLKHLNKYLPHLDIQYGSPYSLMRKIDFAIASSGTATLELALHKVPQIVVYKTSAISYSIGKLFVKTPFIALVNLIAGKRVVPELLQKAFNLNNLESAYKKMTGSNNDKILKDYNAIRQSLGDGQTTKRIASHLYNFLVQETT